MSKTFGKLLEHHIQQVGLLKQDVASTLNIDPSYLAKMLSGDRHPPSFDQFQVLVDLLKLTKSEELDLTIAAIHQKTPLRIKPFVDQVRTLSEEAKRNKPIPVSSPLIPMQTAVTKHIPIITVPDQPVCYPYAPETVRDYFVNNEIINEDFYALRFADLNQSSPTFKRNDLLFFSPYFKTLKTGDFVLVKIGDIVSVKEYAVLELENSTYIQFLPSTSYNKTPFKLREDGRTEGAEIFGKVVFALKGF